MSNQTKKDLKPLVEAVITNEVKADLSSNALFTGALTHFKGCLSHKSVLQGLKEIVETVCEEQKASKAFKQRAINVLTLASKADEYKLHTLDGKSMVTKLYYYNISKAINLLDYLRQNNTEAVVTNVKNKLNKVKKVADKRMYNDNYAKELKDLYKEHKVALTDDGAVIKIEMTKEGLTSLVASLDDELKAFLLETLSGEAQAA